MPRNPALSAALTVLLLCLFSLSCAFRPPLDSRVLRLSSALPVVNDINSAADLEAALASAGDKLLVIDYSTTWCGPCKIVAPKYSALSDKYPDVLFYKCVGDLTPDGAALMKAQGVRSVPAFHFWKGGSKVFTMVIDEAILIVRLYIG